MLEMFNMTILNLNFYNNDKMSIVTIAIHINGANTKHWCVGFVNSALTGVFNVAPSVV